MKSAKTLYLIYCCKFLREEQKVFLPDRLNFTSRYKALDAITHQLAKML